MKNMFSPSALSAALAALLLTCVAPLQAQQALYGVTFFDNQVIRFDLGNGNATLVGQLAPANTIAPYGIASRFGALYTFDANTDRILQFDPVAASFVGSPINIGVGNLIGEGDLAFRSDGIGFLASALDAATLNPSNDLFSFNLATGTSIRIGTTNLGGVGTPLDGMAFSANDVLYGLAQGTSAAGFGTLYTINQTTAELTLIGDTGVAMNSPFGGLTFGPNGLLYAALDDQLYILNPATGAATLVDPSGGGINFGAVSGLSFGPIPEPSTFAFAVLGAVGLGLGLWRRRVRGVRQT